MRILFLFLLLFLSSCSSKDKKIEKKQNVVTLNVGPAPGSFDPRNTRDINSITIGRMLFEGLTRTGKEGNPDLALAESFTVSADKKVYTFKLKEAVWEDGSAITAHDFVATYKSVLAPDSKFPSASTLYIFEQAKAIKEGKLALDELGVHALDDRTLEIRLERPLPYFLEYVTNPIFYPINQKNPALSSGPFAINKFEHQKELILTKNPLYWDADKVSLEGVHLVFITSEYTELNLFKEGVLDWAGSPMSVLPIDHLEELKAKKMLQIVPMLGTYFIRVNVNNSFLSSPDVRRALSLAIPRTEITTYSLMGLQKNAFEYVADARLKKELPFITELSEEKIKELFGSLFKNAPKIKLSYSVGERNHMIAQILQDKWSRLFGIEVQLESNERKLYFSKESTGDYQLSLGSWIYDFNDPINFLDVFKSQKETGNRTGWENAEYTETLKKAEAALNEVERFSLLQSAEAILMHQMPIMPIFHYNMLYVKNPKLKGELVLPAGSLDLKWAYLEK